MNSSKTTPLVTRRELLRTTSALAGGTLIARFFGGTLVQAADSWMAGYGQQATAAPPDAVAAARAQMGAAPIETLKLGNNLAMLSGPGGNVVVLSGPDGKVVVDTFVQPAWGKLKAIIDGMGSGPIRTLINTHWHFDHVDNNASFRGAGATIVAHANTAKRLSESHDLLGMHFDPAPTAARPTETFAATYKLSANGENLELGYIQPAHTDTDIYIWYANANLVHMGDCFFNGMYPFIDAGTGGKISGMIAAADQVLKLTNASTRIVPGHGPLADRAALTASRDMLVTVRDRVQKMKSSGQTVEAVVAAKPTADLDAVWGKGFMQPDNFVTIVYGTL